MNMVNNLRLNPWVFPLWLLGLIGCSVVNSQSENGFSPSPEFQDYWYGGKAELTRYKLEQARYGEIHEGDAVLIFVTEDFLKDKQVKYEGGPRGKNVVPILKLNATRKFYTGIYPYSMMSSIFTPVATAEQTLKVTTSSQEWCGHTFSQLNLRNNKYKGVLYSYFMDEGDQDFALDAVLLEDELWTKIRLDPSDLPTGQIELIPGTMFLRLRHEGFQVQKANASREKVNNPALSSEPLVKYEVNYADINRSLSITYEASFPYQIVAWEEKTESGYGPAKKIMTTKAVKTHSINTAYWGQHDVADAHLRKELGLE